MKLLKLTVLCGIVFTSCISTNNARRIVWQKAVITQHSIKLIKAYKDTTLHVGDTICVLRKIKS